MEIIGEVGLYVDGDTSPYRRSLQELKATGRALGEEIGRTTAAAITREMVRGARELVAKLLSPLNKVRALWSAVADAVVAKLRKMSNAMRESILTAVKPFQLATASALTRVQQDFDKMALVAELSLRLVSAQIRSLITKGLAPLAAVTKATTSSVSGQFTKMAMVVDVALAIARARVNAFTRSIAAAPIVQAASAFGSALANHIGISFQTVWKASSAKITASVGRIATPLKSAIGVISARISPEIAKVGSKFLNLLPISAQNAFRNRALVISRETKRLGHDMSGVAKVYLIASRMMTSTLGRLVPSFVKVGASSKTSVSSVRSFARGFTIAITPLAAVAKKVSGSVQRSFAGMDRTVRLVLVSLLFASGPIAALGSSMSASMIGVAGAAAYAAAALLPLVGVVVPLALGVLAAAAGLKDLEKYSSSAAGSLTGLKEQFKGVAVPAFMKEWAGSLGGFFDSLKGFLSGDIFSSIGKAFASITDSLTGALNSGAGAAFKEALAGPLTEALGTLGSALGPIMETLLGFFAAAAPTAQLLADLFYQWATGLATAFAAAQESGELQTFLYNAVKALESVMGLVGSVTDALGTLFTAAVGPGTQFVDLLTGLVTQFDTWMKSAEGQTALTEFFDGIMTLMPPLGDLVAALAGAIADLITPEVIDDTVSLLKSLSDLAPTLSDVLAIIGNANVVNLLADAVAALGKFIDPLVEPLSTVLTIMSELLSGVLEDMGPTLVTLGEAFGSIVTAIGPILTILEPLIGMLAEGFAQVLIALAPLILQLVTALEPMLTQLVTMLMPILTPIIDLITVLAGVLGPILTPIINILTPLLDLMLVPLGFLGPIFQVLTPIIELLGVLLQVIVEVLSAILTPLLEWIAGLNESTGAADKLTGAAEWLSGKIQWLVDIIKAWLSNPDTDIGKWVQGAWENIKEWGGKMLDWFQALPGNIGGFFLTLADKITSPFRSAFNSIADLWNNSIGKLTFTIPDIVGVPHRGEKFTLPKIPRFATGGITDIPSIFGDGVGREAAVPLDIPTPFVDPSVRAIAAFAKGEIGMGSTSNTWNTNINTPATNGKILAKQFLDEIAEGSAA